jgi:hypothetical protein
MIAALPLSGSTIGAADAQWARVDQEAPEGMGLKSNLLHDLSHCFI